MSKRAWAIKLGSGGICVPFCERNKVIGLGWKGLDSSVLDRHDFTQTWNEMQRAWGSLYGGSNRKISFAAGQVFRFWSEVQAGDFVLYYNPPEKAVRVTKIEGQARVRDIEPMAADDIWLIRDVSYPCQRIKIPDFDGALKGSLLGPRMSFWELDYNRVALIAQGLRPHIAVAPDPAINSAYSALRTLVENRLEVLNDKDWEFLVADYFRSLGFVVGKVGGSQAVIDLEARLELGVLTTSTWRIQVKRYQNTPVNWTEIDQWMQKAGDVDELCFVSVFGFTPEARTNADSEDVHLLEASDFVLFVLGGKYGQEIKEKLCLPTL